MSISLTGHRARVPPSGTPIQPSTPDVSTSTSCFGASAMLPPVGSGHCTRARGPGAPPSLSVLGDQILETELLDPIAQRPARNAEPARRARHVAGGIGQHLAQALLFV